MEKTTEEHELQLKMHTTTEFESISLNAGQEFFVMGTIETPKFELKARAPIEVVAVVDVSGSMSGENLSLVRSTLQFLSHQLQSTDKFSLVSYDSNVKVLLPLTLMTKSTKESLTKYIDSLKEGSNTNLSGGLLKGLDQFSAERPPNTVATVLLMTDGLANEGITKTDEILKLVREIRKNQITVSSFGIGADFDEQLMTSIAEHGSGDYYFLDESKDIEDSVSKAMKGFTSLLGIDAKLKIVGKHGSIVKRAYGHTTNELMDGLTIGDLRYGDISKILIEMEVYPQQNHEILSYEFSYIPIGESTRRTIEGVLNMDCTNDRSLIVQNPDVVAYHKLQKLVIQDEEVQELYKEGRKEEAIEKKKEIIHQLEADDLSSFVESEVHRRRSLVVLGQMKDETRSEAQNLKKMKYYAGLNVHSDKQKREL